MSLETLFADNEHLLYILITDLCNVNCSFCMCKDMKNRDNLILSKMTKENLERLIFKTYKVGISGQGEPFMNPKTILDILDLKGGNINFQIATSGNLPRNKLIRLIRNMEDIIRKHNNFLDIRLSFDRFHLGGLKYNNFLFFINYFIKEKTNLTLSFRSLTTDKILFKNYLGNVLGMNHKFELEDLTSLNSQLKIRNKLFPIEFQSIVNPNKVNIKDIYTLENYIKLLEGRSNKKFTFGNLTTKNKPGLDLTINPNGDLFFYGLECEKIGNIHQNHITYREIKKFISQNQFYSTFIKVPFLNILKELRKEKQFSSVIDNINNPYWIIRNLYNIDKNKLMKIIENIEK